MLVSKLHYYGVGHTSKLQITFHKLFYVKFFTLYIISKFVRTKLMVKFKYAFDLSSFTSALFILRFRNLIFELLQAGLEVKTKELQLNKNVCIKLFHVVYWVQD